MIITHHRRSQQYVQCITDARRQTHLLHLPSSCTRVHTYFLCCIFSIIRLLHYICSTAWFYILPSKNYCAAFLQYQLAIIHTTMTTKGTIENFHVVKESYCPSCQDSKAVTTILPTHIPIFHHICILAITCPLCSFRDSQILFTGRMPSKGKKFIFELKSSQDLDRQIVKSDHALIYVPQLELEIPSETQQGTLSTVEGVLRKVVRDLDAKQKQRVLVGDLENFHRCRDVIRALEALIFSRYRQTDFFENQESEADSNVLRYPFEFILDDPSGLSMIENPFAPQTDESLKEIYYQRSSEQNIALGLQPIEQQTNRSEEMIRHAIKSTPSNQVLQIEVDIVPNDTEESGQTTPKASQQIGRDEALKFPTQCPSCHAHTETAMCIIDIPHFQQVIIMSLNCEKCGFKSNEIKPSGKDPSLKL